MINGHWTGQGTCVDDKLVGPGTITYLNRRGAKYLTNYKDVGYPTISEIEGQVERLKIVGNFYDSRLHGAARYAVFSTKYFDCQNLNWKTVKFLGSLMAMVIFFWLVIIDTGCARGDGCSGIQETEDTC